MVYRILLALTVCVALLSSHAPGADAQGWVVHCYDGNVYRCQTGGSNEKLWDGTPEACNARWSIDGRYIYFMCTNGQIWSMNNNGSNAKKIFDGKIINHWGEWIPVISSYRPDPDYLFYGPEGTNGKLYRIHRTTGKSTLIHTSNKDLRGEIGISLDGKRAVARSDNNLYKISLGSGSGRAVVYSGICSSSLSPDGQRMTKNTNYNTDIFDWGGGKWKTVDSYGSDKCDNNMYSVNSNDHITYWAMGLNGICVTNINDNTHTIIGSMEAYYPHFFLGDIPQITPVISEKTLKYTEPKTFTVRQDGTGVTTLTTIGEGRHSLVFFNALGIPVKTFVGTGQKQYHVTDLPAGVYFIKISGNKRNVWNSRNVKKLYKHTDY